MQIQKMITKNQTPFLSKIKKKLTNRLHNMTYFVTQYANIQKFIDFSKKMYIRLQKSKH